MQGSINGNPDNKPVYYKNRSPFRWLVLFLSCWAMLGSYYCYDNPTALNTQIQDEYGLTSIQYNLLYSVYSIPNTILPLFGGALVDKIGADYSLVLFLSLCTIGQAIFAFGASIKSFIVMLIGRTVFGFGGESLTVAESAYLALYFTGKEVAFAMGLNLSLARSGSSLNDFVTLAVYNGTGSIPFALWVGVFLLCLCLCFTILMIVLDTWMSKKKENEGYFVPKAESGEVVKISDITDFGLIYWLLCISCVVVYGCVLPWNNIGASEMQYTFGLSDSKGNSYLAIPYLTSAILTPPCGLMVDKIGHRCQLLLVSAIALCTSHYLFAFQTQITPLLGLILIGIGYSLYAAAIWPSIALVVKESKLGTAYGLITAIQNIGLATLPLIVGSLTKDNNDDTKYYYVEIFLFSLAYFGVIVGFILMVCDNRLQNKLLPPSAATKNSNNDKISEETSVISTDNNNHNNLNTKLLPDSSALSLQPAFDSPNVSLNKNDDDTQALL